MVFTGEAGAHVIVGVNEGQQNIIQTIAGTFEQGVISKDSRFLFLNTGT